MSVGKAAAQCSLTYNMVVPLKKYKSCSRMQVLRAKPSPSIDLTDRTVRISPKHIRLRKAWVTENSYNTVLKRTRDKNSARKHLLDKV